MLGLPYLPLNRAVILKKRKTNSTFHKDKVRCSEKETCILKHKKTKYDLRKQKTMMCLKKFHTFGRLLNFFLLISTLNEGQMPVIRKYLLQYSRIATKIQTNKKWGKKKDPGPAFWLQRTNIQTVKSSNIVSLPSGRKIRSELFSFFVVILYRKHLVVSLQNALRIIYNPTTKHVPGME